MKTEPQGALQLLMSGETAPTIGLERLLQIPSPRPYLNAVRTGPKVPEPPLNALGILMGRAPAQPAKGYNALTQLIEPSPSTISSKELQYTYSWTAIPPDNPRVTGRPDSTLLNRGEGYEVLPFINRFCKNHTFAGQPASKADALKVERKVRDHPGGVRSHANVTAWIEANW